MNAEVRERDPGLQPERTALSWQRTAFSSLILALATVRAGISHDDMMLTVLGSVSALLSLGLVVTSFYRQRVIQYDVVLTSRSSAMLKGLICVTLGVNALAVTLHNILNLF